MLQRLAILRFIWRDNCIEGGLTLCMRLYWQNFCGESPQNQFIKVINCSVLEGEKPMATATKSKSKSKSKVKLQPLGDRVVVEREDAETTTAGGIVLPDSAQDKPARGVVVSVGDADAVTTKNPLTCDTPPDARPRAQSDSWVAFRAVKARGFTELAGMRGVSSPSILSRPSGDTKRAPPGEPE